MKKMLVLLICVFSLPFGSLAQNSKTVIGSVSDGKEPLSNVAISIEGQNTKVFTDEEGRYTIKANEGDILNYAMLGMKDIDIKVEDVTRVLNPVMIPDAVELDLVDVKSKKRLSQKELAQNYEFDERILKTAYGFIHAERSPGLMRFVSGDQIPPSVCLLDALRGRVLGLTVQGDCWEGGNFNIKGSLINDVAIYDIDGAIFLDFPIWLDPQLIERVGIVPDLGTIIKYGGVARGGVIVINTVNSLDLVKKQSKKLFLNTNILESEVLNQKDIDKNKPTYLKALEKSTSLSEAKSIFAEFEAKYKSSPYFFLDAHAYFTKRWNEFELAETLLNDRIQLFENNAVLLKALAYQYDSMGQYARASEVYKDIFVLRPDYAQSYMDMANSYRAIGEPVRAAGIYTRYGHLAKKGLVRNDTITFGPMIAREFNNLVMLSKGDLVAANRNNELFVDQEEQNGTRLVFEWNDGEAEFDLQFVNPDKQYYMVNHSLADTAGLIAREKDYGFNVMEHFIDEGMSGSWQVNVNYKGNKSLTPTYLKATVYHNYGTQGQRKEVKVFKLSLKNVNQELFELRTGGKMLTSR